ncbi:hypothetical protein PFISCL1PPCAC_6831, partial [Pristionchus fissidentatus]
FHPLSLTTISSRAKDMRLILLSSLLLTIATTLPGASRTGLSTVGQLAFEYVVQLRSQQQDLLDTLPPSRQKNQVKIELIEDELNYIRNRKLMLTKKLKNVRRKKLQRIRKTASSLNSSSYRTAPPEYLPLP